MKRNKVNQVHPPALHHNLLHDREETAGEDKRNELAGIRMLENLKMALFFSRIQSQMGKEQKDGDD
ncbi:hypothetical protein SAMN05421747_101497 [Parapedobacter composti]|uniref:Uncharacterized protein n=1 Tax=Parapedobacter composti TaxID=623281 RepID=A0A1I1ECK6_9SPHI|nr:hypothetical protein [Parapedobacter composti]SFB84851.1 hypothetical protein SAMN05421747_101497 [Parapedobacter composti]